MASGPEMMLKAMGIDLTQIDVIIKQMISGINSVNAKLATIEKDLAEIKAHLNPPNSAPLAIEDRSKLNGAEPSS